MEDFIKDYFIKNPISITFTNRGEIEKIHKLFGRENSPNPSRGVVSFWQSKNGMGMKTVYRLRTEYWQELLTAPYVVMTAKQFFNLVDFEPNVAFNH